MKNHQHGSPIEEATFSDRLIQSPIVQAFLQNGRIVLYCSLGLLSLFVIGYRLSSGNEASAERDYVQADGYLSRLQREGKDPSDKESISSTSKESPLEKLKEIIARRPELHAKYDGLIAHELLKRHNVEIAKVYANTALERTDKIDQDLPLFREFAKASLIIAEGNNSQALEQALSLKDKLTQPSQAQSQSLEMLYAFNLLRIAMLHQQLGSPEKEKLAWKELQQRAANSKICQLVLTHLEEGQVSLQDYIESRLIPSS